MWSKKLTRNFIYSWIALAVLFLLSAYIGSAYAASPDPLSHQYRSTLTRSAQAVWGLNAPTPVFAAQIQQESGWNPNAVSKVGAKGMAQFMPASATWWCSLNKLSATDCQPTNPTWAMRALVGYDKWLYDRVWSEGGTGGTGYEYDRMHAALRAYNGGLGHWQAEAKIAQSRNRIVIDRACGMAKRSKLNCPENLNYPKRILNVYQPRYYGWGRAVMMTGGV